jgi:IS30 family transposase
MRAKQPRLLFDVLEDTMVGAKVHMTVSGQPITAKELARILDLRLQGYSWAVIAERFGRTERSLQTAVKRHASDKKTCNDYKAKR